MKAAHNTLPFGTRVKVSRTDNPSKSVEVQINDRGPFVGGRIIDLSVAAAEKL
jgi:rare lipoprotein A